MVTIDKSRCISCGACVRGCSMGVFVMGETGPEVHPKRRCIQCMHCAAACPREAIGFSEISPAEVYPPMPEDALEKLLKTRRSIRHFQEKLPPKALIEKALDTAMYAPSGKNQRAYEFTVLWGVDKTRALRDRAIALCDGAGEAPELGKLLSKGTDLLTCNAPVMIVAWSPDDCLNPVLDPAAAMAQLELTLVQAGLGTCWGGYLRQVSDRFPELREMLGIREGCHVRCALMTGYAEQEPYLRSVWRPRAKVIWI